MKFGLLLAGIPALLCSTAVFADDAHPYFGLSATGGVTVLRLPTGQNGILTSGDVTVDTSDPLMIAPTIGFSGVLGLGKIGDYDAFMGVNAFAMYGTTNTEMTQNFSGVGVVYIPGISTPADGSIDLTTTRGATATATSSVNAVSPEANVYANNSTATSGPADGGQSDAAVDNDGQNSFVVSGSNTHVASGVGTSLAYGGIADHSGSILIIAGDLDGLSIATSVHNTVIYAGADATLGASGRLDDTTSLQAYAGPSYRYIGQWTSTKVGAAMTVDIPEAPDQPTPPPAPTVHPLWIQDTLNQVNVNSHYVGGVIGATITHRVSDTVTVALGAEGSLYYTSAHLNGRGSVTTTGGDGPSGPSPTVTVDQDPVDVLSGGIAYAVRAQASATMAINPSMELTAAANVDYLSKVARPYGGATITGSGGDAHWSSGGGAPLISFGDMLAFGGTVSLTGHF